MSIGGLRLLQCRRFRKLRSDCCFSCVVDYTYYGVHPTLTLYLKLSGNVKTAAVEDVFMKVNGTKKSSDAAGVGIVVFAVSVSEVR